MDTKLSASSASLASRYDILRQTALLKDLTDEEVRLLAACLSELTVPRGEQLLVQGELASHVFWLVSGSVHVIVHGEIVAQVDTVQCFGEMSCLIPGSTCSATVTAVDECKILRIDQEPFLKVLSTVPKLWQSLFVQMSKRLSASNKRLSEVLAHVPQGFMKLDKSARVTREYSEKCVRYFGEKDLSGRSFTELLKLTNQEEDQSWHEVYDMLFTDSLLPFDDLTALLTTECRFESDGVARDFNFTYYPSMNTQGTLEAVDVGIEDVTELKRLEIANAALQYEQAVLGRIYSDPESFLSMLELMSVAIADCDDFYDSSLASEGKRLSQQIEVTMRSVHSLKGMAGLFGLEPVARCCDEMAIQIRELEQHLSKYAAEDVPALLKGFTEDFGVGLAKLKREVEQANNLQNKIGETLLNRLKGVVFSQSDFDNLRSLIKSGQTQPAMAIIDAAQARDAKLLFANWNIKTELLARTLSKAAKFELQGGGSHLEKELFGELASVLVHVMNNAVDHGIELPADREDQGKLRHGLITANIATIDNRLEISVSDDGRGIDFSRLPAIARSKPHVNQQAVNDYEQSGELWRILLLPGFTTSSVVTRHSGYGVGLDSLNQLVLARAGSLRIESTLGEGTTVHISLPLSNQREAAYVS